MALFKSSFITSLSKSSSNLKCFQHFSSSSSTPTNNSNNSSNSNETKYFNSSPPKFYALQYKFIPDVFDKRPPHRPSHLNHCYESMNRNELVAGGPFSDAPLGALLIFKNNGNKQLVEEFAKKDPYVVNKLVTEWTVNEWNVTVSSVDLDKKQ